MSNEQHGADAVEPDHNSTDDQTPIEGADAAAGATGRCGWFCFCGATGTSGRADGLGAVTGLEAAAFSAR